MVEQMKSSNSYKSDKEMAFMAENPHLKLMKSFYDPHTQTIYLTLFNNHNAHIPINDLNISKASNLQYFRCLVNDIFYC